jgi:hypothetical protein
MVKLYEISNPVFGKVFQRITKAFHQYSPSYVEWVDSVDKADKVILEVVGGLEYDQAQDIPVGKLVLFQQCVFTSGVPLEKWYELWNVASGVMSFHPLTRYFKEPTTFNFLHTPLGAEPNDFPYIPNVKRYRKVITTGHIAETECIDKLYEAAKQSNTILYHTGENFGWETNYAHLPYMIDSEFARVLNSTEYVAGLRAIEGFEAMCLEGAMVGATPIIPKLPTYEHYDTFGQFIDLDQDVVGQLKVLFENYTPLSREAVEWVRDVFAWKNVMHDIYKFILG